MTPAFHFLVLAASAPAQVGVQTLGPVRLVGRREQSHAYGLAIDRNVVDEHWFQRTNFRFGPV